MKFLCLHGAGTSSNIFEIQLGPILEAFSCYATFEFFDGIHEVEPVNDVKSVFAVPFYTWYSPGLGGRTLEEAKEDILEIIKTDGPFDGCIGFSQGGSLLASVIMDHQRLNPFGPNLFQLAVFICAAAPLLVVNPYEEDGSIAKSMALLTEPWRGPYIPGHEPLPKDHWHVFNADRVRQAGFSIRIPTAHIYGCNDEVYRSSVSLRDMCDDRRRVHYDHGAGHEIPRSPKLVQQMIATFQKAIDYAMSAH